jgi:hypothetical protein
VRVRTNLTVYGLWYLGHVLLLVQRLRGGRVQASLRSDMYALCAVHLYRTGFDIHAHGRKWPVEITGEVLEAVGFGDRRSHEDH